MTIKSRLLIAVTLCFSSSNSALADDFIIDGPATTTNNGEVLDGDDTITVTNTGSVSIQEDRESGLSALGDNNVLVNSGDVSTFGFVSHGLSAVGNFNALTNYGDVSTNDFSSDGLYAEGNFNALTNYGDVSTTASSSDGLHAKGDFNTITNSENGVVSAIGGSSAGLFAGTHNTGDNNTLVNRGIIITDGGSGHAMHAGGSYNTLTNSGDINVNEKLGGSGHGMFGGEVRGGDFNIVTNTGSITTNGGSGHGMTAGGSYNTLTNSGDIIVNETLGGSGHGISGGTFAGVFNTLTNSGNIRVNGGAGNGMSAIGDSHVLTNSGNISVNELGMTYGQGLDVRGNFNTLINSGNITVAGQASDGLKAYGDSNTITNSGTVLSELAYIVSMTGKDATLNLLSGSVLSGKVHFSDLDTATLNFGSGLNTAVTLSSTIQPSDFTITAPGPYTVVDDTVYVADLGDAAAQNRVNTVATRMIHDAVASRGIVPAVTQGSSQPGTWASVSGGLVRNNGDANLSGYDGNVVSGSFGRDRLDGTSTFGGVSLTQTKTDNGVATDAIGVHGGIYGQLAGADYTLSGGLGYLDTERERANNMLASGLETASDSYLSAFISPAMTWHGVLGDNDSLRLRYTGTFYGSQSFDYEGEGDLEVESRITHQIEVRMAWARVIETGTIRYGFDLGYQSDDAMDLTLAGQNLSATTPGDAAYGRVFASMDFANATVEASYDNNNEFGLTGSYSWRF
jgi:hypothetical protein